MVGEPSDRENDVNDERHQGRHRSDGTPAGTTVPGPEYSLTEAPSSAGPANTALPPDAAARDAARRDAQESGDNVTRGEDIRFVTRQVTPEERAAVVSVLTQVRAEESQRVKRVARRDREPWARSQRVPEGISDLLAEG